jgi:hypothetical protein
MLSCARPASSVLPQRGQSTWLDPHLAYLTPETIDLGALDPRILFVRHPSKALARSLSERLPLLGSVDAGKPNLVLGLGVVANQPPQAAPR